MIRRLMASTAIAVLATTGSFGVAAAQTDQNQQQPAVIQQDATAAPADASGGAAATAVAAGEADPTLTPDQPTIATAFIGRTVFSSEDPESDNIGEVNDLIIGDDGMITHAVVGVGGFLGIGEKDVAVPFDELQVVEQEGDIRLIYAATKEQLEAAEGFDRTAYDPRARFAEEQQQAAATQAEQGGAMAPAAGGVTPGVDATAEQQQMAADPNAQAVDASQQPVVALDQNAQSGDATQQQTADATQQQTADATQQQTAVGTDPNAQADSGFVSFNADQVRASALIGKEVYGSENESIGEVSDLVLQDDGETRAALIDVGGFLGVGEKEVSIPFDQIQVTQDGNEPRLTVAMSREQLEQAPAYEDRTMAAAPVAAGTDPNAQGQMAAGTDPNAQPVDPNAQGQMAAGADPNAQPVDPNAQPVDPNAQPVDPNAQGQMAAGTEPTAQQAEPQFQTATQDLSAGDLIGSAVFGPGDENIGEVGDVVFDKAGGIQAVIVDVGGFLGVGEKSIAVQFDSLNVQKSTEGDDYRLMVNTTQEQLQNAPAYEATQ